MMQKKIVMEERLTPAQASNRDKPSMTISSGHIESCFHSFDIVVIIRRYHIVKSSLSKKKSLSGSRTWRMSRLGNRAAEWVKFTLLGYSGRLKRSINQERTQTRLVNQPILSRVFLILVIMAEHPSFTLAALRKFPV